MRILIVGQFTQKTGFSRIVHLIAEGLCKIHDVHVLGIDNFKNTVLSESPQDYHLYQNNSDVDVFAERSLKELVDKIRPEAIILYHDPWFIPRFLEPLEQANHKCIKIGYIPIDGHILQPEIVGHLSNLDALVVFTNFGKRVIQHCAERIGISQKRLFKEITIIPHILDVQSFFPLSGNIYPYIDRRIEARRQLFPDKPHLWEGFWILNANKNQFRKRIDLTIEGFARFVKDKPGKIYLYLHTASNQTSTDIRKAALAWGIENRIILTRKENEHPDVSKHKLNLIYNACDVGLNTSQGEGWGLVTFEHAATGAAQIVPAHSACLELWNEAAELIPIKRKVNVNCLLEGSEICTLSLSDALNRLYFDANHYQKMLKSAFAVSINSKFSKTRAASAWDQLLSSLVHKEKIK